MGECEDVAESADGRVFVDQLLLDRQCLAVLGLRLRCLASRSQHLAAAVVADRQAVAVISDGWVFVDQLLLNRERLAMLGLCFR